MVNLAVIGAGSLGSAHATTFARIDGCQVKRVYDIISERAENLAAQIAAQVAGAPDGCFSDDIDAVVVATPTDVHAEYCLQAARVGKHIFCEKPMTRTTGQADEVVEAVRESGVKMMVGHVLRFFPEYQQAREMVRDGAVGKLGMVRLSRINSIPRRQWYGEVERSGGVILDMIIHDFDWLLWTLGKPDRVYAKGLYERMPLLDYALCTYRFPSGAIAHVEGSWADMGSFRTSFEITGSGGLLAHDSASNATLRAQKHSREADDAEPVQVPSAPAYRSPQAVEDELFIEALVNDTEPPVTVEEGREAVRLALATLKSAQTGRVIAYP